MHWKKYNRLIKQGQRTILQAIAEKKRNKKNPQGFKTQRGKTKQR